MALTGYRTIISAGVALLGALLKQAGVEIDEEGVTTAIMTIGGAASAIWFRFIASKDLIHGDKLQ